MQAAEKNNTEKATMTATILIVKLEPAFLRWHLSGTRWRYSN